MGIERGREMTILIADDDKNILTLLTAVLSREGFSILTAGTERKPSMCFWTVISICSSVTK